MGKKANMEKWQSLVTKISQNGDLEWQRVDTLKFDSSFGSETACEYVTQFEDGHYAVTLDDENGMGYALLLPDAQKAATEPQYTTIKPQKATTEPQYTTSEPQKS